MIFVYHGVMLPDENDLVFFRVCILTGQLRNIPIYLNAVKLFYLASPQEQGHHNSVSQLLWARITYPCQLSLWEETEYPQKTHDFWQSVEYTLSGFECM